MNAQLIAGALGGKKVGTSWLAFCPAHENHLTPSLALRDDSGGRILVHCHAGCEQRAVVAALRARGLWGTNGSISSSWEQHSRPNGELVLASTKVIEAIARPEAVPWAGSDHPDDDKRKAALALWQAALSARGSIVEIYLASRGISLPPPESLRFSPALKHPSGTVWPAMVALVTSGADGTPLAIHRTFLAHDGSGKAPVSPQKMMLGPCRGGAVPLAESGAPLLVGEGLETCLSGTQMSGHPAWAALSTSGLRALDLPSSVRDIMILADADAAGEAAAWDCGRRWQAEGRRVRIARPGLGKDFNDVLLHRASRIKGDAQ